MFGIPRLYLMAGAGIVIAIFLGWVWRVDSLRAQHKKELIACQENHARFVADVKDKTELARMSDAAHKAEVERDQEKARAENDTEIRRRIDAAVANVRLRQQSQTSNGRSGAANLPGAAHPTSGSDRASEASVMDEGDQIICSENTVKAQGWKDWNDAVQSIPR